jgi:hypothetical protein
LIKYDDVTLTCTWVLPMAPKESTGHGNGKLKLLDSKGADMAAALWRQEVIQNLSVVGPTAVLASLDLAA